MSEQAEQALAAEIERISQSVPAFWERVEYHEWLMDQLGCDGMTCPRKPSSPLCEHVEHIGAAMVRRFGD